MVSGGDPVEPDSTFTVYPEESAARTSLFAADEGEAADSNVMVQGRRAGEDYLAFHLHMAPEKDGVCHDDVVFQMAIMGDVRTCHEEVVVSDDGLAPAACRAGVNGDKFPDDVAVPDDERAVLALEFEVLRVGANDRVGEYAVVSSDRRAAGDIAIVAYCRAAADFHVLVYDHVHANGDIVGQLRFRVNVSTFVDVHWAVLALLLDDLFRIACV
jgi:hypothetical protein